MSSSAEVPGHSPGQRAKIGCKRSLKINDLRPIGNCAVKIVFSARHDTFRKSTSGGRSN